MLESNQATRDIRLNVLNIDESFLVNLERYLIVAPPSTAKFTPEI